MTSKNIIQGDKYRFTVLTNKLLRLEYSESGQFEDRTTKVIQNRDFDNPDFDVIRDHAGHQLEIVTDSFHLYYEGGKFSNDTLFIDAKYNFETYYSRWYFGEKIEKNLKGTARTLDKADGEIPLEDGLMTKGGFSVLDDSKSFIQIGDEFIDRDHTEDDFYYFAYGRDYLATLKAFYRLTGSTPIVPRYALGNWWSRFYPYTQDEYLQLMKRFENEKLPIAVSVFDMNWHTTKIPSEMGSGWTGYTWNRDLFPDPKGTLKKMHDAGRKVTLNVHPAAGIRPSEESYPEVAKSMGLDASKKEPAIFNLQNPKFVKAYFDIVHHGLENKGVDFWWLDWQQGGSRGKHLDPLWLLNVLHYNDNTKRHPGEGLILSRYAGPGSHRYPIGFSGDSVASWKSLQFQPYFTATASNIGYTWWSHDIGGHMHGRYNAELSLRWMQFGVFSPVLRLHSSDNLFMGKEPWNYDEITRGAMNDALRLRAKLVPYIDTANELTHRDGEPLIQPLYYKHPTNKKAYQFKNEYYFGNEMLVAPITTPKDSQTGQASAEAWLPEGHWTDFYNGIHYQGNQVLKLYRSENEYPVFVKDGSIIPLNEEYMQSLNELPQTIRVKVYPGADARYHMYEHQQTKMAETIFTWNEESKTVTTTTNDPAHLIPANRSYIFEFVGYQADVNNLEIESTELDNKIQVDQVNIKDNNSKITQLFREKLQHAEIDFDDKMQIWRAFVDPEMTTVAFVNYLNTLDNPELAGMLSELAVLINK
ncbi:glycoside hydrolase family 31 protein [Pediococcus argentinicus]|uniref:Alpha-glucosidase n=1 Tax=Pediococcus argentinicus TaxID=480391 RepID=A0A0R2NI23_9LACO|nr:TIM-barrel domain-containing protein [Pediococcus argentinicus]KRO25445.1 alpha-glucosidase [Pediococcus argentinicus]NKZ22223.1 alpha-xylosidase [Pediococcus argentinicus]GEP19308.1 alpha-glucosidase [Pediococcus argentinicus]